MINDAIAAENKKMLQRKKRQQLLRNTAPVKTARFLLQKLN